MCVVFLRSDVYRESVLGKDHRRRGLVTMYAFHAVVPGKWGKI